MRSDGSGKHHEFYWDPPQYGCKSSGDAYLNLDPTLTDISAGFEAVRRAGNVLWYERRG